MKKMILFFISLVLMMTVTGCASNTQSAYATNNAYNTTPYNTMAYNYNNAANTTNSEYSYNTVSDSTYDKNELYSLAAYNSEKEPTLCNLATLKKYKTAKKVKVKKVKAKSKVKVKRVKSRSCGCACSSCS